MKKEIVIKRSDFLWRFYCKNFTVNGKEIQEPKNLCNYFWTPIAGIIQWFAKEVKLRLLWGYFCLAAIIVLGSVSLFPHQSGQEPGQVARIVIMTLGGILGILLSAAVVASTMRLLEKIKQKVRQNPRLQVLVFLLVLLGLVALYSAVRFRHRSLAEVLGEPRTIHCLLCVRRFIARIPRISHDRSWDFFPERL